MPCIEEWLSNPLLIIDSINADDSESQIMQVKEYFSQRLIQEGVNKVQSVNEKSLDHLKPNTLVRFRCMIQDMFEPEYYLSSYETINRLTEKKDNKILYNFSEERLSCRGQDRNIGLYRDVASCQPGHEVDFNSLKNVTKERQCFYCVPIPGETTWAKKAFGKASGLQTDVSTVSKTNVPNSLKRNFIELQQSNVNDMSATTFCSTPTVNGTKEDDKKKRNKPEGHKETVGTVVDGSADLNFPLPDENGPACIVKVYGEVESFKVNDIVEFVGVLCVDPLLTEFRDQRESDSFSSPVDVMEVEEQCPQSLPSSLVPRIHAVAGYKLRHSNPLFDVLSHTSSLEECQFSEITQVRGSLLSVFGEMLYGDSVAAEYFLLHLMSTIYSRPDVLALGKYTVNLIGCSKQVAEHIYQMVEYIVPKCHRFPMSISNLNKSKLVPKKDYATNRLNSGKLQISDETHLILDETVLEEGQLDNTGVLNISALNHIISWQKVQYDFSFYKTDFPTNIVILVLSEGKSLLQADSRIKIVVQNPPVPFEKILQNYGEGFFENVRKYIGLARLISYEISSDIQKYIEDDFVQMRQAAPGEMTVERFHSFLCLARLMAISHGRNHLLQEDWRRTKELENVRQSRLPQPSH